MGLGPLQWPAKPQVTPDPVESRESQHLRTPPCGSRILPEAMARVILSLLSQAGIPVGTMQLGPVAMREWPWAVTATAAMCNTHTHKAHSTQTRLAHAEDTCVQHPGDTPKPSPSRMRVSQALSPKPS